MDGLDICCRSEIPSLQDILGEEHRQTGGALFGTGMIGSLRILRKLINITFYILQLVSLALRALKEASADPISEKTCSVAVVGKDTPFRLLEADQLSSILENLSETD